MSATDELRRLLDGRGVEWRAGEIMTFTDGADYMPAGIDKLDVSLFNLTPAQAVEATIERGECRMEPFIYEDTGAFIECSECGWQLFDADYSIDAAREWLGYCPNCGRKVVDA